MTREAFDVFFSDGDGQPGDAGWYWHARYPIMLPCGGDPIGPFETERDAKDDAQSALLECGVAL